MIFDVKQSFCPLSQTEGMLAFIQTECYSTPPASLREKKKIKNECKSTGLKIVTSNTI